MDSAVAWASGRKRRKRVKVNEAPGSWVCFLTLDAMWPHTSSATATFPDRMDCHPSDGEPNQALPSVNCCWWVFITIMREITNLPYPASALVFRCLFSTQHSHLLKYRLRLCTSSKGPRPFCLTQRRGLVLRLYLGFFSSLFTLFESLRLLCCSSDSPGKFLPQGLCLSVALSAWGVLSSVTHVLFLTISGHGPVVSFSGLASSFKMLP